jgi:carbon storage regulator
MLVLSRKTNESIMVDHDIEITVISVCGNRVKLGFEAPGSVQIMRAELIAPNLERQSADGQDVFGQSDRREFGPRSAWE